MEKYLYIRLLLFLFAFFLSIMLFFFSFPFFLSFSPLFFSFYCGKNCVILYFSSPIFLFVCFRKKVQTKDVLGKKKRKKRNFFFHL